MGVTSGNADNTVGRSGLPAIPRMDGTRGRRQDDRTEPPPHRLLKMPAPRVSHHEEVGMGHGSYSRNIREKRCFQLGHARHPHPCLRCFFPSRVGTGYQDVHGAGIRSGDLDLCTVFNVAIDRESIKRISKPLKNAICVVGLRLSSLRPTVCTPHSSGFAPRPRRGLHLIVFDRPARNTGLSTGC